MGSNVEATNVDIDQTVNVFNPGTMELGNNLFTADEQEFFKKHSNFK